ncbi:MAG TPA: hypothetical protein VMS55_26170 [Myxococcota bacterium]|nr:hypothetical protein [Myxococcota bacterium]
MACASDLVLVSGRYVQRKDGLSFAEPEPGTPPWQRVEIDDTLAAWERPGGARITVQAECHRKPPSPQVQARSLLIGVERKELRQSGPVAVGPWPGWSQEFDVGEPERPLHLKTVTLVAQDCTVDFLLLAGDDFEAALPGFDAWWKSFEKSGAPAEAES